MWIFQRFAESIFGPKAGLLFWLEVLLWGQRHPSQQISFWVSFCVLLIDHWVYHFVVVYFVIFVVPFFLIFNVHFWLLCPWLSCSLQLPSWCSFAFRFWRFSLWFWVPHWNRYSFYPFWMLLDDPFGSMPKLIIAFYVIMLRLIRRIAGLLWLFLACCCFVWSIFLVF